MNQPDFQDRVQFHHESKSRDLTPREQLFKEQCDTMIGRLKPDFCVVTVKNDSPIDAEKAAGGVAGRGQGFMEIPSKKDPSVMLPLIPADRVVDIIIETERKVLRVKRPWSVMFSPRSLTQSYLLLDDLDQEKRDRIKAHGYEPTYEQSTSPESFHMVFAIPKIQDKIVGDEVVLRIIHLFVTDVGATGIDREMRLPGSCNGKPTRTLKDGTQPVVTVLGGTAQQCQKMNNLVRELLLEIEERVPAQPQTKPKTNLELLGRPAPAPAPSRLSSVIWQPAQRYAQRKKGAGWTSEHDFHAAVALRSGGFTKDDIQSAIYSCAPRNGRDHSWIDYARRTADAAFSESGERAMSRLHRDKAAMRELKMDMARAKRDARVAELHLDSSWCSAKRGERIEGVVEHLDIQRVIIRTGARFVEIVMQPSELPIESRKIGSNVAITVPEAFSVANFPVVSNPSSQDRGAEI